jgi:hypothetical protein
MLTINTIYIFHAIIMIPIFKQTRIIFIVIIFTISGLTNIGYQFESNAQSSQDPTPSFPLKGTAKTTYSNQCLDNANSSYWPDAIGANRTKKICQNMCGAASAIMALGYYKVYPFDNNPRTLRNRLVSSEPEIPDNSKKDGNAAFGGAFAITSVEKGDQSDTVKITKLFGMYGFARVDASGSMTDALEIIRGFSNYYNRVKLAIDRGNPVIMSSYDHIRLAIGYDNKGGIIFNDPWNNTKSGNAQASVDGKFIKYNGTLNKIGNTTQTDAWFYIIEHTPISKPTNSQFTVNSQVKANALFSDDPISGLSTRTVPAGPVISTIPWKTAGVVIEGPKYGGSGWFYRIKWSNGVTGWSAETYLKPANYDPANRSTSMNNKAIQAKFPDGVNIRVEPDVTSKLIKFQYSFQKGKALRKVAKETELDWYEIQWDDGTKGWSATTFIDETLQSPTPINQTNWTSWAKINLRSKPTSAAGSEIIREYGNNSEIWVIEEAGSADGYEWVKVVAFNRSYFSNPFNKPEAKEGYMVKQGLQKFYNSSVILLDRNATYITSTEDLEQRNSPINLRETANGTSKISELLPWGTDVKIIDGTYYSYGFDRVKIRYTVKVGFVNVNKEGWIPIDFLKVK